MNNRLFTFLFLFSIFGTYANVKHTEKCKIVSNSGHTIKAGTSKKLLEWLKSNNYRMLTFLFITPWERHQKPIYFVCKDSNGKKIKIEYIKRHPCSLQ